jgi:hypothetical protein
MPVGFRLPVQKSSSGGIRLVDGDENDNKIIRLALSADDNENAFNQDIGLGEEMIFNVTSSEVQGKILARLRQIFAKFESQKRYRLFTDSISWEEDKINQELILNFKYLNMESDEVNEFSKKFASNE